MLGRFFVLLASILFGSLAIETSLYHSAIAIGRDPVAMVPTVTAAAAMAGGFLLLGAASRATVTLFATLSIVGILVGVVGTAIHLAIHAPNITALASQPRAWLGNPPALVPLSFSAGGCLGLLPLACGPLRPERSASSAGAILQVVAALASLLAAIAATDTAFGFLALMLVLAAMALGGLGYAVELADALVPMLLSARRPRFNP